MKITGAQALIRSLCNHGTEVIFGYPGGQILPIYDALYDCEDVQHILMRHEQGAAHAADAYARATGKVGVCFATSGPGATNLVTGIANAYMDSIPMVAITGQVRTTSLGKDAFQEADITGITMPITKHNYLLKNPKDIARVIAEAFYIASTGRPGPVLVDVPMDVSLAQVDYVPVDKVELRSYKPTIAGHPIQIAKAAKAIAAAERPVIYAGGGVISADASEELVELAERTNILVTTTLLGKGAIPETHPHSLGMLGMHGTAYANYAVAHCDLLVAIGARFDDRVTGKLDAFAKKAKVIHIDVDPAEVGKTVHVDIPIVGDCKKILIELLKHIRPREESTWNKQVMQWKTEYPLKYTNDGELYPQFVIEEIWDVSKGDAVVVVDVGQHQMWAAQYYKCTFPKQFITSGGLGTMGFSLPAAIGAQVARPDKAVFNIVGDGGIQMTIQELMPAVVHKLPIKIVIMNNQYLGMVRQWQELFWNKRYSSVDLTAQPDFIKLADAYGAVGMKIEKPEDVRPALLKAMEIDDRPTVMDFRIAREENVFPMIPAGQSIEEMMLHRPKIK
ncbi:MAG TPA: biosynthetic-type acetolactate synthase large subunit [Armatimonadota bacterium]|nr:biosynthetic-type acetolactate synthase large subunit [Armatimonadota bacterium]